MGLFWSEQHTADCMQEAPILLMFDASPWRYEECKLCENTAWEENFISFKTDLCRRVEADANTYFTMPFGST
jgi:hypothetical protein